MVWHDNDGGGKCKHYTIFDDNVSIILFRRSLGFKLKIKWRNHCLAFFQTRKFGDMHRKGAFKVFWKVFELQKILKVGKNSQNSCINSCHRTSNSGKSLILKVWSLVKCVRICLAEGWGLVSWSVYGLMMIW